MLANDNLWTFLASIPWWAWIPIIAILGGMVQSIIGMSHKHQERLEMIRKGMDPRVPPVK